MPRRRVDGLLQRLAADEVRSRNSSCHWSCWSPPGVPQAITGLPVAVHHGRADSVVRGRRPGASDDGSPSSSQNICIRLPRGKPSSGMVGELCSQPPLGVAEMMLPQRSTTSTWQVSPRVTPVADTVGSPVVRPARRRPRAGRCAAPAVARARRASRAAARATPRADQGGTLPRVVRRVSSAFTGTSDPSPYQASRSAKASLSASACGVHAVARSTGRSAWRRAARRAGPATAAARVPGPTGRSWRPRRRRATGRTRPAPRSPSRRPGRRRSPARRGRGRWSRGAAPAGTRSIASATTPSRHARRAASIWLLAAAAGGRRLGDESRRAHRRTPG